MHLSKMPIFLQLSSIVQEFSSTTKLRDNLGSWNLFYVICWYERQYENVE